MRLETERLVLRPLSLDDLDPLAPFFADPDVMRYMGGKTLTRDETEASIARLVGWFEADGFGQLAVVRKDDGELLGRCGILIWETEPWKPLAKAEADGETETEIGYALGQPHWGLGYATEAASGESRLIALIQHGNEASRRVAEKLGMEYERDVELRFARVRLYALGKRPAR